MNPLFFLGVSMSSMLVVLAVVMPKNEHEQNLLLAPGQTQTSIALAARKERVQLSGVQGTTWVTLNAPTGKRFKLTAQNYYTFTTQAGQHYERTFELLKAGSDTPAGSIALQMTARDAESPPYAQTQMQTSEPKRLLPMQSHYFYVAAFGSNKTIVDLNHYFDASQSYIHVVGNRDTHTVVLNAPSGEVFTQKVEKDNGYDFVKWSKTNNYSLTWSEHSVQATATMEPKTYWFIDAQKHLYSRVIAVQYTAPYVFFTTSLP